MRSAFVLTGAVISRFSKLFGKKKNFLCFGEKQNFPALTKIFVLPPRTKRGGAAARRLATMQTARPFSMAGRKFSL